jgi:hypothetical protein
MAPPAAGASKRRKKGTVAPADAASTPGGGGGSGPAAPELPPDIWRIIYDELAQTDILRSADVVARDIGTAACLCRRACWLPTFSNLSHADIQKPCRCA